MVCAPNLPKFWISKVNLSIMTMRAKQELETVSPVSILSGKELSVEWKCSQNSQMEIPSKTKKIIIKIQSYK